MNLPLTYHSVLSTYGLLGCKAHLTITNTQDPNYSQMEDHEMNLLQNLMMPPGLDFKFIH